MLRCEISPQLNVFASSMLGDVIKNEFLFGTWQSYILSFLFVIVFILFIMMILALFAETFITNKKFQNKTGRFINRVFFTFILTLICSLILYGIFYIFMPHSLPEDWKPKLEPTVLKK